MSATTSTAQKDGSRKEDERDPAHRQQAEDREQPLDNVAPCLASEAQRVKGTLPGTVMGIFFHYFQRQEFPSLAGAVPLTTRFVAASSGGEGQSKSLANEPVVTKCKPSTEAQRTRCFEDLPRGPTLSDRAEQVRVSGRFRCRRKSLEGAMASLVVVTGRSKYKRDMLGSEDTNPQSVIDVESSGVSRPTRSVSARPMLSTDFVTHSQEEFYCGNTKSDVAMYDRRSLHSDSQTHCPAAKILRGTYCQL